MWELTLELIVGLLLFGVAGSGVVYWNSLVRGQERTTRGTLWGRERGKESKFIKVNVAVTMLLFKFNLALALLLIAAVGMVFLVLAAVEAFR